MTFDPVRRRAVMSRSIRLKHCVCDTKKPCPCDTFKAHNVCQCAGERLPVKPAADVKLTRHVHKAGCASKIGQADLLRILSRLPPVNDPNVLVGLSAGDDAGVYRISDQLALVQTVDVFTPCVDDPVLFGRIAAANSVSDVYAMGGTPLTALSIVAFPIDDLDGAVMESMLRGAMATLEEARCALVGGHSIQDAEIKLGFAVTGLIDPRSVVKRAAAKPGDVLVLTKPLGTGMIAFAAQLGRASDAVLKEAGEVMATLNRDAAEAMQRHGAHAATDVTGFGLAGHLVEMARGSGVSVEIELERLPAFRAVPGCLTEQILSGAVERNQDYAMGWMVADTPESAAQALLYDPQTSGGLLVSLPRDRANAFVEDLRGRGHTATSVVGRVLARSKTPRVFVRGDRLENLHGLHELT
jgi:selenide,water dikinase